jgi:tetratricopeptide (TPR) repeat protein
MPEPADFPRRGRAAQLMGRSAECAVLDRLLEAVRAGESRGQGAAATYAHWVAAILRNGLGHYEEALAAARQASEDRHVYVSAWILPELIEAAARSGNTHMASDALDRLAETTRASGTDSGLGMQARSRALLSDGETGEGLYREAIDRLGRTELRLELARAHLLYGEWLRRRRRRTDAREQLRVAHNMLEAMGAKGFAERARRELRATGETARKRTAAATNDGLTAQETQIALAARSRPGALSCPRGPVR